jgi:hypothetical protein
MGEAIVTIALELLPEILQLPDYLETKDVYLDKDKERLILVLSSDLIPDNVKELVPVYTFGSLHSPERVSAGGLNWENPPRFRMLKEVRLIEKEEENS